MGWLVQKEPLKWRSNGSEQQHSLRVDLAQDMPAARCMTTLVKLAGNRFSKVLGKGGR